MWRDPFDLDEIARPKVANPNGASRATARRSISI
jgi:hypothetical protein